MVGMGEFSSGLSEKKEIGAGFEEAIETTQEK